MLLVLLVVAAGLHAKPEITDRTTARRARRARLAGHLGKDYALVIGQPLTDVMNPRQEGHFLYLTGIRDHGAILLLGGDKAKPVRLTSQPDATPPLRVHAREIVFLRELGDSYAQFHGLRYRPGAKSARALGVEAAWASPRTSKELGALLARVLPRNARLHIHSYRGRDQTLVREIRRTILEAFFKVRKKTTVPDLRRVLAEMRSVKEPFEVEQIERAIAVTHEAFRAAAARIRQDSTEAAVDAALLQTVRRAGAHPAYPFVVGSGPHAPIPHYFRNDGPLRDGDLLVIDAGAAVHRYAADITRTFPVNGSFTPRQRECYEVVLKAQLAAIEQVRPGNTFARVHQAARDIIAKAGMRRYFIHGTSHHVGLDVHDPGPGILKPGMTLTVEPGIYIPDEQIGIRIEDIILVTSTGHRVLGSHFPKTVEEVEAFLAEARSRK